MQESNIAILIQQLNEEVTFPAWIPHECNNCTIEIMVSVLMQEPQVLQWERQMSISNLRFDTMMNSIQSTTQNLKLKVILMPENDDQVVRRRIQRRPRQVNGAALPRRNRRRDVQLMGMREPAILDRPPIAGFAIEDPALADPANVNPALADPANVNPELADPAIVNQEIARQQIGDGSIGEEPNNEVDHHDYYDGGAYDYYDGGAYDGYDGGAYDYYDGGAYDGYDGGAYDGYDADNVFGFNDHSNQMGAPLMQEMLGIVQAGPVTPVDPIIPAAPVAAIDPGNHIDPIVPANPIDPADPFVRIDPVGPDAPLDPIAPFDPITPVDPVDPVVPIVPAAPIDPVVRIDPVEPFTPPGRRLNPMREARRVTPRRLIDEMAGIIRNPRRRRIRVDRRVAAEMPESPRQQPVLQRVLSIAFNRIQ